jgi:hypothetical protein
VRWQNSNVCERKGHEVVVGLVQIALICPPLWRVSHYGSRAIPRRRYQLPVLSIDVTTYLRQFLRNSDSTAGFSACENVGLHISLLFD